MTIHGHLDSADRHHVAGWCRDDADPDRQVDLVVTINGTVATRVRSNTFRPDLASFGAGGQLSFRVNFEPPLSPLVRCIIEVRAETDGVALAGSPIVIEPSSSFDADTRQAIAGLVGTIAGEAEAEERLGFLADQVDGLLRAKQRLRTGANERATRRKRAWSNDDAGDDAEAGPRPRALVIGDGFSASASCAAATVILSHLQAFGRLGYAVSFVPADLDRSAADAAPGDVTVMTRPWYGSVEEALASHRDAFDVVVLHQAAIAAIYAPLARRHQPSARIVFAITDLVSARLLRQAKADGAQALLARGGHEARLEQQAYEWSDVTLAPSRVEAAVLRDRVWTDKVHVVPVSVRVRATRVPFAARGGLAFFADYNDPANVVAAVWLAQHVMPAVAAHNPSIQCLLVGSAMPDEVRALGGASLFPLGAIDDVSSIVDRVRLTVAPQSAEARRTILDSLGAGLPCVCAPTAAAGLDLPDPLGALVASDPADIAALIVRLHDDETFHAHCAAAGRAYVEANASDHALDTALRAALAR